MCLPPLFTRYFLRRMNFLSLVAGNNRPVLRGKHAQEDPDSSTTTTKKSPLINTNKNRGLHSTETRMPAISLHNGRTILVNCNSAFASSAQDRIMSAAEPSPSSSSSSVPPPPPSYRTAAAELAAASALLRSQPPPDWPPASENGNGIPEEIVPAEYSRKIWDSTELN